MMRSEVLVSVRRQVGLEPAALPSHTGLPSMSKTNVWGEIFFFGHTTELVES